MAIVYVVHGWGGSPQEPHISWLREQLDAKNINVQVLEMPNTDTPVIDEWVGKLKEVVKDPDKNTYFIAHSIGGQAVMRYLTTLPESTKVGGVIFLAGWFVLNSLEDGEAETIAKPWVETPIDFELLRTKTDKYIAILSDNDKWVPVHITKDKFEQNLGAKVIIEHNQGHFTEEDGVTQIPIVLTEFGKILKP